MIRTIFNDEWGEIREYKRYRGRKGRFISEKYARRELKLGRRRVVEEIEQWRISEGKRSVKIMRSTPSLIMKKTYPGSIADNEGLIYKSLEQTNVFTQISKASRVLYHITGYDEAGNFHRFQNEINVGNHNQAMQLTMAIRITLADDGFRVSDDIKVIHRKGWRRWRGLEKLVDVQFTLTLML